ncbi:MAG: RCC1 domain-containing protein [Actinomycetes bacterium]
MSGGSLTPVRVDDRTRMLTGGNGVRVRFGATLGTLTTTVALCTGPLVAVQSAPAGAVVTTPSAPTIAAGGAHTCATVSGGLVICWGKNTYGQLGDGTVSPRLTPVSVANLTGAVAVGAGDNHSCAVRFNGAVLCWGANSAGQLGDGTNTNRRYPTAVSGVSSAVAVVAGLAHSCALLGSGSVVCWGQNTYGQLGDGTNNSRNTPGGEVVLGQRAVAVSAGNTFTCAVLEDGTGRCWGGNSQGQLGNNSTTGFNLPQFVSGMSGAVSIASGSRHSCAGLADGSAVCWGDNSTFQIGNNLSADARVPVAVSGLTGVRSLSAGSRHTCALRTIGSMVCWGDNFSGRLGDGSTLSSSSPVTAVGVTNGVEPALGTDHSCVRGSDGFVMCWGLNLDAQVGDGTTTDRYVPTRVQGFQAGAGGFTGVTPFRLLDTRAVGGGACIGAAARTVTVAGVDGSGVPATAAAVALNVTVTNAKSGGFLTVYPSGTPLPLASNLNFIAKQTVANNATVAVSSDGQIDVYANAGCPDAIVDVVGFFSAGAPNGGGFQGIAPVRIFDTRGIYNAPCITGSRDIQITPSAAGVPADAVAVALNVTAVTPSAAGFLTVYPTGVPRPTSSTLNYTTGSIVPNGTTVKIGGGGKISVYALAGCPQVVVDVVGWFVGGSPAPGGFVGLTPFRLADTRSDGGCLNLTRTFQVAGVPGSGVPLNATSVALNVTAVGGFGAAYITAYPAGVGAPTASTVNFLAGQIVANGALVKVGLFAADSFTTNQGCPHVVVDVVGYFAGTT